MNRSRSGIKVTVLGWSLALLAGFGVAASQGTDDVSILLLGVVKLNGSDFAASAAQARQLLPLVQAWRAQLDQSWGITRGASATAAAIRAILTSEQLTQIQAMHLSLSDAIRWGGGAIEYWMWRSHCWGSPCSGEGTPPTPDDALAGFLTCMPTPENPYIGFANRVVRVLSGWAAEG
ncbi:MAG: hypothetical protein ABFD77_10490 [Thermotogota bacterium]